MARSKTIIKNITVATDFSDNSHCAIVRAVEIAKETRAKLTIVHVVQDEVLDTIAQFIIPKEVLQTPKEYATTLIQEMIYKLLRHKIKIEYAVIPQGKPALKLLHYIKKNKTDLLVIGAHGRYSVRDTFVGTTAEYLAERSECPVLIIKSSTTKPYKKILASVDFSPVSKRALIYAAQLFPASKISIVHVGDHEFEHLLTEEEDKGDIRKSKIAKIRKAIMLQTENEMKNFLSKARAAVGTPSYKIIFGYPAATILNEATRQNSSLIVMGTQGHGKAYYNYIGSVANWVLSEADQDILLVPLRRAQAKR